MTAGHVWLLSVLGSEALPGALVAYVAPIELPLDLGN